MSEYREWSRRAASRGVETTAALQNKRVRWECEYLINEAANLYFIKLCGGRDSWGPIIHEWCNMTGELEILMAAA